MGQKQLVKTHTHSWFHFISLFSLYVYTVYRLNTLILYSNIYVCKTWISMNEMDCYSSAMDVHVIGNKVVVKERLLCLTKGCCPIQTDSIPLKCVSWHLLWSVCFSRLQNINCLGFRKTNNFSPITFIYIFYFLRLNRCCDRWNRMQDYFNCTQFSLWVFHIFLFAESHVSHFVAADRLIFKKKKKHFRIRFLCLNLFYIINLVEMAIYPNELKFRSE